MRLKLQYKLLLLITLPLAFSACGGGGISGTMNIAPEGDFTVMVGINPKLIIESDLFKQMLDEIKLEKEGYEELKKTAKKAGIEIDELSSVVLLVSHTENNAMVHLIGKIDFEDFIDYLDKEENHQISEEEESGLTYYADGTDGTGGTFYMEAGGGLVFFSQEELLEDCIDVITKGKDRLTANEKFSSAMPLVNTSAAFYALIWDKLEIKGSNFLPWIRMVDDDEEVAKEITEALEDVIASGISLNIDKGITGTAKVRFDDEDSAEAIADFLDDNKDKIFEKIAQVFGMIFGAEQLKIDPEKIEDLADSFDIGRNGDVVVISIEIEDLSWLIKAVSDSLEESELQAATMQNIKVLGTSVEQYRMDHPSMGYPETDNIEELIEILIENEYVTDRSIIRDGWGNLLDYRPNQQEGVGYSITSYGAGGVPGPPVAPNAFGEKIVTHPEEDIIWSDGRFVQHP